MDRDRGRRFDDRRGGESYRPSERTGRSRSRSHVRRARSPPRNRSPRQVADTWVPHNNRHSNRARSRSPVSSRRASRSPPYRPYRRTRSPLRQDLPRRERPRSPPGSSWRSKSPYRQRSPRESPSRSSSRLFRDPSRTGYVSRSPRRDQSPPPPHKYQRASPPRRQSTLHESESNSTLLRRSRSPIRREVYPKHYPDSISRRHTPSPSQPVSSAHASVQGSASTSRRSSPPTHLDSESRSSVPLASVQEKSHIRVPASPMRDEKKVSPFSEKENTSAESQEKSRVSDSNAALRAGSPQLSAESFPSHEQQQPKTQSPGISRNHTTSQDTSSNGNAFASIQSRGSSISLLSAPTRPRGGPSFNHRDSPWAGNVATRRGPGPSGHHGPPIGPRNSFLQAHSSHDPHRHSYRHNISTPATNSRNQRAVNHLSGLPAITAGGKILPSVLDPVTERRLAQLEADREKLLEQVMEKQQLKRIGLKDWNRLDRESMTNALKSELAEGHLQRMAEGESLEGSAAF
ncbi:hypothetical protein T310_9628 [Rasamsonia emersonii CBS 393.64]|uniref:Serine/arginine repetitive matrix protein 1 n=1 Tax=Rasamsonia emersonii (strain ATCC 16479 / CBS 393.64 / IMI 116815) TaxID=1408163 RepID=A0A0F4YGQ8_RASE3|nr:hypothetical protein T310_9628 [Rasamsonia emersonii CBS 393.64]KKA16808.1 hypothetical protein T310_9628 [Rasamsonia emersonii CBS 393.64]